MDEKYQDSCSIRAPKSEALSESSVLRRFLRSILLHWRAEQATANVSCPKTFFLVNSVYTNNVLSAGVHV